jgi:SAM-dependent methyltransferase
MRRTHDKLYLNEDSTVIKDVFIAAANEIGDNFSGSIADVGCATGAFPRYLKQRIPSAEVVGIEYLEELRVKAIQDYSNIRFLFGDVTKRETVEEKFDVITMLGVLGIFDDYELVLSNVLSWLKTNGKLVLHSMISEYDIDVFVRYARSNETHNPVDLESGWNIISQKSLRLVAEKNSAELISCAKFSLSFDLKKNKDDVMRSWTEWNSMNERDVFNALHFRQPQKIAVIKKLPT